MIPTHEKQLLNFILDKKNTFKIIMLVFCFFVIGAFVFYLTIDKKTISQNQIIYNKCVNDLIEKVSDIKALVDFEQYPVKEVYTGKIAPLDLNSNTIAHDYRTTIRDDLSKGVNFAGHYVISEFKFTGFGTKIGITDVYSGKVYSFPYVANTGLKYTSTSSLLIIDPKESIIGNSDPYCMGFERFSGEDVRPYYFVWENNMFRPLQTDEPLYKSEY
jgi:hypothetical protein